MHLHPFAWCETSWAEKQPGNFAPSTEHYRQQPKQMTRKFNNWVFGINMPAGKSDNEYSECVPPGTLSTSQENFYSTLNSRRNEFLDASALTVSTKNLWEGKTKQQSTRDLRLEPMYIDVLSESTSAGKSSRKLTCLIVWLVMLTIISFASLAVTVFIFYKGGMTNEKSTSTTLDTNGGFRSIYTVNFDVNERGFVHWKSKLLNVLVDSVLNLLGPYTKGFVDKSVTERNLKMKGRPLHVRKFGFRNPQNFYCGIRDPGLWNPEYR